MSTPTAPPTPPASPEPPPPMWVVVVGAIFGGVTLLFLMLVVLLGIMGKEVPQGTRFTLVAVIAFGTALSTGFLGGAAAVRGNLPLPFLKQWALDNPIAFSLTGGVAVLVIVLFVGYYLYVKEQPPSLPNVYITGVEVHKDGANAILSVSYRAENVEGYEVFVELAPDHKFHKKELLLPRQPVDDPAAGKVHVGLTALSGKQGFVRLVVVRPPDTVVAASEPEKFTAP